MAKKTLAAEIEDLEEKLTAPAQGETVENLSKALVDVSGVLKDSVGKTKKVEPEPAKPVVAGETTTTTQTTNDLLKSLLDDDDPPAKTTPLAKTFTLGDETTAVDVSEFVLGLQTDMRAMQDTLTKSMLPKKLMRKALAFVVDTQRQERETEMDALKKGMGLLCASMGKVLDWIAAADASPVHGSQFATMEKSIAVAKAGLLAEGGTPFPMNARNKDVLAKARMNNLIDDQMLAVIKKTQVVPPGVSLTMN